MGDELIARLIEELKRMFGGKATISKAPSSPVAAPEIAKPSEGAETYQAPIKGTFYNSGDFSLSSPNPRHPNGHMGVDMRAAAGTPVYSLAPGQVSRVASDPKGGNSVNIQHANGVRSYYAHLSTVNVHQGDKVDNNTIIGSVGTTGNASSTWPHLHFQVWKNNQIQNPANFFTMPKYTEVDKTKEKLWASPQAKQEASAFNMEEHLAAGKRAFTNRANKLVKIAYVYEQLSKKS